MTTQEILKTLNDKFGMIQDQSWFVSLQKTAHSKNITAAEWNSVLLQAARTANDCDALKTAMKDFIDVYETNASDVERTLELHAKGLASIDASKVSKVDSANVVYATDSEGAQTSVHYSKASIPGTLAVRDISGNIQVSNPTANQHAASKKYVDDKTNLRLSVIYDSDWHTFYVELENEFGSVSRSDVIDLPLEATVIYGRFDKDSEYLILTLQNGTEIPIPLGSIISGLATETYVQKNYVQSVKNTGNVSVLYGERGNGAGPTQFKINSGAAGYAVPYRDASGQVAAPNQVNLPPSQDQFISRRYFEANLPSGEFYYDHIITTEADFLNIGDYSGNVLVKGVTLSSTPVDVTLKEGTHLTFIDFNMPSDGKLSIDGMSGTIRGFHVSSRYATVTLKNFSNVKQVSCGAISRLCLVECQHISDSKFYEATSCTYIDNCDLSLLNAVYINDCKYVCGIRASSTIGVGFSNCSFISNVDCNGTYENCTYVDAESCKGFITDEDVDKVQVLTNDGAFNSKSLPKTFIDVIELPDTDVDTNSLYRKISASTLMGNIVIAPCSVVDALPEIGEPVTDASMSTVALYYLTADGGVYGYVDDALSNMLVYPSGWTRAEPLFDHISMVYVGIVDSLPTENTGDFSVLVTERVYVYSIGKWREIYPNKMYLHTVSITASHEETYNSYTAYATIKVLNHRSEPYTTHHQLYDDNAFSEYLHLVPTSRIVGQGLNGNLVNVGYDMGMLDVSYISAYTTPVTTSYVTFSNSSGTGNTGNGYIETITVKDTVTEV